MPDTTRIEHFIHTLAALRDEEWAREEARRRRIIAAHVNRFFEKFSGGLGAQRLAEAPRRTEHGG